MVTLTSVIILFVVLILSHTSHHCAQPSEKRIELELTDGELRAGGLMRNS